MTETKVKTIHQALLEAQKKIEPVVKDATNPYFKSTYATLGGVIGAIKTSLNDAGLTILQPIVGDRVITKVIYTDGQEIVDGGTPIVCSKPNDPQAQGSAITYARRYGLMSLLCLSAEDDDGEKATSHKAEQEVIREVTDPLDPMICAVCGEKLEYKTGTTKAGKNFEGYFCPNFKPTDEKKHTILHFKYL